MIVKSLKINNLRNLSSVEIHPGPALNLFIGENGAGKTSVLEALIVLAKGRSFRPGPASSLIGPAEDCFRVIATVERNGSGALTLGLQRSAADWRARVAGKEAQQLSELAPHLPLVLMEPNSHLLVSGAPDIRRRYLDWGVFHVEQDFLSVWRRYMRALKQRNAALRSHDPGVAQALDAILSELGERIDAMRRAQLQLLERGLPGILERLGCKLAQIEIRYQSGWAGDSLAEALMRSASKDLERRSTGPGPQRADVLLLCDSQPAREILSRGEQKMVAAALLLAQAEIMTEAGKRPVLLLDDLASEFDHRHRAHVLAMALESGAQTWVTGTDLDSGYTAHGHEGALFHVEQGAVTAATIA